MIDGGELERVHTATDTIAAVAGASQDEVWRLKMFCCPMQ